MNSSLRNRIVVIVAAIMLVALGFIAGTTVYSTLAQAVTPVTLNVAEQGIPLNQTEATLADVYNRVSPSVVAISVIATRGRGEGSGFVIDQQGHIVTNYHVVEGARQIEVNFFDGTIVRAEIVGLDPESDLAVIQVNDVPSERLIPAQFGDSDALVIGQQVVAIGSPFSQRWTMTFGIISALQRTIESFTQYRTGGVIQTDAPINPGNSGGPLLNLAGQVIGVNSQITNTDGRFNAGVGFAIPSNLVSRVATELINTGRVGYSFIGISGAPVSLEAIEELGLANNTRGVVVSTVLDGGPAQSAGLLGYVDERNNPTGNNPDIITAVNGEPLTGMDGLISYLATHTVPGQTVTLTVLRNNQEIKLDVVLTSRPGRSQ